MTALLCSGLKPVEAFPSAKQPASWSWQLAEDRLFGDARLAAFYELDPCLCAKGLPIAEYRKRINPGDRNRVVMAVAGARKLGGYSVEFRVVPPHGPMRHLHTRARYLLDRGIPRMVGITIDFTELALEHFDNDPVLDQVAAHCIEAERLSSGGFPVVQRLLRMALLEIGTTMAAGLRRGAAERF
jgi:hypothetical protein